MDPASLLLIGVTAVAIIAAAGAFTIAYRRSEVPENERHPGPRPASEKARRQSPAATPVAIPPPGITRTPTQTVEEAEPATAPQRVTVVEVQRIVEVSPEEGGVTRRQFFNRALAGSVGAFLTVLGLGALAFYWPRLTGGFGSKVDAGTVVDIKSQLVRSGGQVNPFVVSEARAYVVPISPEQVEASQFNQPGLVAEGLMAMWWRCVHLGCRAPWCAPSAGFECPCHGSKYNLFGEYQAGPAPRNLDRFAVEVTSDGRLIIDTGTSVQTPRAPQDSVPYPQGPSCIAL